MLGAARPIVLNLFSYRLISTKRIIKRQSLYSRQSMPITI